MKSAQIQFVEALTGCQETLRAYCHAKVAVRADAEDALQATNIKLWEKEPDWDRERPFLPWALGVAHYVVLSHYRDCQRERLVFEPDVVEIMEKHLMAAALKTPELILALRHCLSLLTDQPREALKAHYLEGWSLEEISKSTGRSVSGVKSWLFRLRQELAGCIEREGRA